MNESQILFSLFSFYMCQLDQDKWNYQYQSNAAQAQQLDPRLHSAPKILYVMDSTRRL